MVPRARSQGHGLVSARLDLREGMTQKAVSDLVEIGYGKMQLRGEAMVLFGPSAALPHGSKEPRTLKQGDVVLLDDGCTVEGYCSDVTRTAVFGKPTEKLEKAFEAVRKAQDAALDAARAGKLSGSADDSARNVITAAGFGPSYKFFIAHHPRDLWLAVLRYQPYSVV